MSKNLQVVFILDITGSMSTQLNGAKEMILDFCKEDVHGVSVHVWTFTEVANSCFVSTSDPKFTASELSTYVSNIKLCCPSDFPNVKNAHGEDGPENVTAALVQLLHKFDPTDNILSFIITDNLPHHKSFQITTTSCAELKWISDHGHTETDIYQLLNKVVENLNVTIVPILYSSATEGKWYEQAAATTDGIMLNPTSSDSKTLSRGLTAIMKSIQKMINGDTVTSYTPSDFAGFSIKTFTGDYNTLNEDTLTRVTNGKYSTSFKEINAGLLGLLESTRDRFSGKKSSKRCKTVDPSKIQASIKVLVLTMLKLVKSTLDPDDKQLTTAIKELVSIIKSNPSDTTEYELHLLEKYFNSFELLYPPQSKEEEEEILQCVISLDSALSILNDLEQLPKSDDDIKCWMDIVLESILVRLIDVKFPVDVFGNPDFMDSWSAVINGVSLGTVVSASSAIKLRDNDGFYRDPLTRQIFSSAVVIAHPNDRILSTTYRVLSTLPTLQGLVQGYLVSGGLRVFPSLTQGLQASTLMKIVRNVPLGGSLTQAEWELSRSLIYSLQVSLSSIAKNVFDSLNSNQCFNPADNISKLVAGIIRFQLSQSTQNISHELLVQLFEEISSDYIMTLERVREKNGCTDLDLLTDSEITRCIITMSDDIDPLKRLHEAESITMSSPDDIHLSVLYSKIESTTFYKRIRHTFLILSRLLLSDVYEKNVNKISLSDSVMNSVESMDSMTKIVVDSVILKKRTGRYELLDDSKWKKLTPDEIKVKQKSALIDIIHTVYKTRIVDWNSQRLIFAKQQLFNLASKIDKLASKIDIEKNLEELEYYLLGKVYKLSRMDSLELVKSLPQELVNTVGMAFVLSPWTSEPVSCLRRFCKPLLDCFAKVCSSSDLKEIQDAIMAKQICTRVDKTNRHGHTIEWPFPGNIGWTEEYHKFRLLGNKNLKALEKHRKYTLLVQSIEKKLEKKTSVKGQRLIKSFLYLDFNPNVQILPIVERIYASSAKLESIDIEPIILKMGLKKPLKRVKKFLDDIGY